MAFFIAPVPPLPVDGGFNPVLVVVFVGVVFPELFVEVVSLEGDLRPLALAAEDNLV